MVESEYDRYDAVGLARLIATRDVPPGELIEIAISLSDYLACHGLPDLADGNADTIRCEQDAEMGRPSAIVTRMILEGKMPTDLWLAWRPR